MARSAHVNACRRRCDGAPDRSWAWTGRAIWHWRECHHGSKLAADPWRRHGSRRWIHEQRAVPMASMDADRDQKAGRRGVWARLSDQFGFRQLVTDYLIPVESNSIWYLLGGVLAIALGPGDPRPASCCRSSTSPMPRQAYGITQHLLADARLVVRPQLPLLQLVPDLRAGDDPHGPGLHHRWLSARQGRPVAGRRGPGRPDLRHLADGRGAALGRGRIRRPVEHLRGPRRGRAGRRLQLHHGCRCWRSRPRPRSWRRSTCCTSRSCRSPSACSSAGTTC